MNVLTKKSLSASFATLYRIQFYSFVRNVKPRSLKSGDMAQPQSSTGSKWTKVSKTSGDQIEEFLKSQDATNEVEEEIKLPQQEEVFDHTKFLQAEIRRQRTLKGLFEYYTQKKPEMDLINVCTALHQAITVYRAETGNHSEAELAKRAEVIDMINHLKARVNEMDNFTISNFLSNVAKMNVLDRKTVDTLVAKTLKNNIQLKEKPLTYITWTLGKLRVNNPEFLDMVAKSITQTVIFLFLRGKLS